MSLNPQQLEVVHAGEGAYLVSAVPGSGKTTCVTQRTAHLISRGVNPAGILVVTFTNKAARELQERLRLLLDSNNPQPYATTFHSFCARLLREHAHALGYSPDFTIYDQTDQEQLLKQLIKTGQLPEEDKTDRTLLRRLQRYLELTLENLDSPKEASHALNLTEKQQQVAERYQHALLGLNALDFTGLLSSTYTLLNEHPAILNLVQQRYRYVMVDEFQDTNTIQYELIRMLGGHGNVMVVGDLNQSIYRFRLAVPENLLRFEKDFNAKNLFLELNYRSTPQILSLSQRLIEHNRLRKKTVLKTHNRAGPKPVVIAAYTEDQMVEEAIHWLAQLVRRGIPLDEIAVLYRTNMASLVWERQLRRANIAYQLIGAPSFYARKEIKLSLSLLKALANPKDSLSFLQVCVECCPGFGEKHMEALLEAAQTADISAEEAARSAKTVHLGDFLKLFDAAREMPPNLALLHLLQSTPVWDSLSKESTPDNNRCDNVEVLSADLASFLQQGTLTEYLQQTSLTASSDTPSKSKALNLMTIHAAKGLEFQGVLVSHLIDGVLPHKLALTDGDIEEERRLLYVAMTRAKKHLCLAYFLRTAQQECKPSRFMEEMFG